MPGPVHLVRGTPLIKLFWSLLTFLLFLPATLDAQRSAGEIIGTVTDPSGKIILKAKVTAVERNTSSVRETVTNDEGFYAFSDLQPGDYAVSVEVLGFARFLESVQVTLGSRTTIDAALSLNEVKLSTNVVGEGGVQVETRTQMLSQVISGLQITELPTITRNPYDLVSLAGDVSLGDAGLGVGVAINGQRGSSTNITLDGAENTNSYVAAVGQNVPLDSVSEFRISQSTFTAEYGRASGGMVDVQTRSGTNGFHGSLYEFNRVSDLAANTFDNNANGIPRGVFTRNQFGYSIGGPVLKDRLFFFQSTEWTRVRSQQTQHTLIPTPQFIAAAAPATEDYFSKFGGAAERINGTVYTKADLLAQGLFPNPGGPFDALPLETPIWGTVFYNAAVDGGGGSPQNSYSWIARLDFDASDKTKMFGRFALEKQLYLPGVAFSSPYPGYDESTNVLNKNIWFNLTHVFSTSFVSLTKVGFDRLDQQNPLASAPPGPSLDFGGDFNVFGVGVSFPGYPEGASGLTQYEWQAGQDVTWTRGKHEFRAGGQYFHIQNDATGLRGTLAEEQLGDQSAESFDNFLLGQVNSFIVAINPQGKFPCFKAPDGEAMQTPACTLNLPLQSPNEIVTTTNRNGAAYAQDTWRVSRRLTLNLGLRWEYYGVQTSNDQSLASNFFFGPGSNFAQQIRSGRVLTVPESPNHTLWNPDYKNFGPRVGFAWDVFGDATTSLRGGYGISFEGNFSQVYRNLSLNPPTYSFVDLFAGTVLSPTIPLASHNLGPFAAGSGSIPFPDSPALQVNANLKTAYAETWSLTLERQLVPNAVLSVAYSASHGLQLYSNSLTDSPGAGVVYGGDDPSVNPLSTLSRQYETLFTRGNGGASIYNALLVRVQGQNVKNTGLTFTANYTLSHTIDNISSSLNNFANDFNFGFLDPLNPNLDRGNAEFDIRNSFVASVIWQEPQFRNAPSRWERAVLGGWTIASIFTATTGAPFTEYDCSSEFLRCPRYIPSAPVRSTGHAIDTGEPNFFEYIPLAPALPYANPLTGISDFGNCALVAAPPCPFPANMTGRDYFRGPGRWSLDFGIYKNVLVHEGWTLQFRGELFDVFNHANLYANTNSAEITANPFFISASRFDNRNVQLALKLMF